MRLTFLRSQRLLNDNAEILPSLPVPYHALVSLLQGKGIFSLLTWALSQSVNSRDPYYICHCLIYCVPLGETTRAKIVPSDWKSQSLRAHKQSPPSRTKKNHDDLGRSLFWGKGDRFALISSICLFFNY
ncbi:hypothetical protein [Tolypothrix sp. NIES-4075]|uniref:hypothetical protein n=1 Tax=Tolypothrix sp. NIES-4075 TaxID=2005459 RepID=UPI00118148D8|nr:hypothetical protein [Tolypothrix sp. NIES-4075]